MGNGLSTEAGNTAGPLMDQACLVDAPFSGAQGLAAQTYGMDEMEP